MKGISSISDHWEGLAAGIFLTSLSTFLALPSLWDAWRDDPYSTGGFSAFLIWLASLGIFSFRHWRRGFHVGSFWIVLTGLLCAAGSITSLRVCHHLALACAMCGLAVPIKQGWFAVAAGLSWLPATGWLVSRLHAGGMQGWERPALAGTAAVLFFACLQRKPDPSNG